jgi:AcrR family transcriptional regulator
MSRKSPPPARKVDPRVERTQDSLGDALIRLMHEKPFESITVQEVLDRARVGRSTFYAHFRDKDDLFLTQSDHFFHHLANVLSERGEASDRVAPVRELFAHVGEVSVFYKALIESGKIHEVMELAQGHFARGIERRIVELATEKAISSASRAALSHALAGALLSMLTWWLDHRMRVSPAEMDDLYHQMVWSGVSGAGDKMPLAVSQ